MTGTHLVAGRCAKPVRLLLLCLFAALVVLVPATAAEGERPVHRLYLSDSLITCPGGPLLRSSPEATDVDTISMHDFGYSKYSANWLTPVHAANWSLTKGDFVLATIFISGWENLTPAPHPERQDTLAYELFVVLRSDSFGEYGLEPNPSDQGTFGQGWRAWFVSDSPTGIARFEVPVEVLQDVAFVKGEVGPPAFAVEVRVHGATSLEARPLKVHVAPGNVASHILVPGFPAQDYAAAESWWAASNTCKLPATAVETEPSERRDSPLGIHGMLVMACLLALAARRFT